MSTYENRTFQEEVVVLDGNVYRNCKFVSCQLVFRGGDLPMMVNDSFNNCEWRFDGAASRTIAFMTGLYRDGASGLIEKTFEKIRSGGSS